MPTVLSEPIETYLTDHLAGAEGALKLIEDLREHAHEADLAELMDDLRAEIGQDRDDLLAAMDRLGVTPGRVKQLVAAAAESLGRLALPHLGKPEYLSRLLALEALSAGIWTKLQLWRALAADPQTKAAVGDGQLQRLMERARTQLDRLEPHHAEAAERALGTPDR